MDPRDRLIVALDVSSVASAEAMIERLGDAVTFYKIGYQLAFAGGLPLAERLTRDGKRVFLDLKLHDIGNTVAKGVDEHRADRGFLPDGPCLSTNHASRGRGLSAGLAHSRGHRAHVLRQC